MRFQPWRGDGYGQPNSLGLPKRLLVLGESHYGDAARETITQEVVGQVFDPNIPYRYRFFTNLFNALCGKREATHRALEEFCHAIAFYNFIQDMLEKGARPTALQWEQSKEPFLECLDRLKPSHVVACGFTLWDNTPHKNYSCLSEGVAEEIVGLLPEQGKRPSDRSQPRNWVGRYNHAGGSCLILRLRHPSVGFSAPQWRPVLQRFFGLHAA